MAMVRQRKKGELLADGRVQVYDEETEERIAAYAAQVNAFREMPYEEYLQTDHWRRLRHKVWKRAKGNCETKYCNRRMDAVHHVNYERLGQELLSDLQATCYHCHRLRHKPVQR